MKQIFISLCIALSLASCAAGVEWKADYKVVPLPQSISINHQDEAFRLNDNTVIVVASEDSAMMRNAEILAADLKKITGFNLQISDKATDGRAIFLSSQLPDSCKEAYRIQITEDKITVDGASDAGAFYGLQTLTKSINIQDGKMPGAVAFPAGEIYDYPRFAYRGAHLDCARHFFSPDSVKVFIDMIALHNINTFHWHLTDDQGWRVEIKSRPELAEKGQWRSGTVIGAVKEGAEAHLNVYDSIPYGGYYTQSEIKDIVNYAADKHITVIPEIDLPGHMQAALATYPHLGCTGGPYEVWRRWGVSEDVLCAGNDSVYQFITDVLGEVLNLFPSEYVHIGGDECPKIRWEHCPKCQAMIQKLKLKDDNQSTAEQKLQTYIMSYATDFLKQHGRKVIGWDEMLEGGMPDDAVVMSWRGIDGAVAAAHQGHNAILTPSDYCYFDFTQADQHSEPQGAHWGHPVTVSDVYHFDPSPASLTTDEQKHIIGVQANLWCEYIPTMRHAQYMELPRLAALSEVQWCDPEHKNFDDFIGRLSKFVKHYEVRKYNYAKHVFNTSNQ